MRIVGGIYKGRVLKSFDGLDIRPTSDMARESLFNILRYQVIDARFLDLFSGTGAMGLEALSRGAKSVTLNDFSKKSLAIIKENATKLGVINQVEIKNYDALYFIRACREKFDVIFLDPPYGNDISEQVLNEISTILSDDGVVVFENENGFNGRANGLKITDERKYGRARFTFFKKEL